MMRLSMNMIRKLLLLSLLLPVTALAQNVFHDEGKILRVNNSMINLSDAAYALSPTAQVRLQNNKPGQISDLRVGDYAAVTISRVGKKKLVDSIRVIDNVQSNESMPPGTDR